MINFSGAFQWFGAQFEKIIERRVDSKLTEAGKAAVRMARGLVPVDTSQTKNSIGFTVNKSKHELSIHADTYWAVFVEKGTRFMRARPFLEPSLKAVADTWGGKYVSLRSVFANAPSKYHAGYRRQSPTYTRGRGRVVSTQIGRGKFQ